jgi:hypothetical protein
MPICHKFAMSQKKEVSCRHDVLPSSSSVDPGVDPGVAIGLWMNQRYIRLFGINKLLPISKCSICTDFLDFTCLLLNTGIFVWMIQTWRTI